MTDPDAQSQSSQASWELYTGLTPSQCLGSGWQQAIHQDDLAVFLTQAFVTADCINAFSTELRLWNHADQEYHVVKIRVVPIYQNDQLSEWVFVATDIQTQKDAEQLILQYTRTLERSNRELEQFTYVASHDLQEPLRKVISFGERLKKYMTSHVDKAEDYLDRMLNSAQWMSHLVQGLLKYSRVSIHDPEMTSVELRAVIDTALKQLEVRIDEIKANISIEGNASVSGDAMLLTQLFLNLLSNALKYRKVDQPCLIVVKIMNAFVIEDSRDDNFCGEFLQCHVDDNGIGVSVEYQDRIFEMFEREFSNKKTGGTGIGLAICRQIMDKHFGSIRLGVSPLGGTRMTLSFPAKTSQLHPSDFTQNKNTLVG